MTPAAPTNSPIAPIASQFTITPRRPTDRALSCLLDLTSSPARPPFYRSSMTHPADWLRGKQVSCSGLLGFVAKNIVVDKLD